MREPRRRWRAAAMVMLAGCLAAACSAVQMGEGPPPISPGASLAMRAAPIKGADARFAILPIIGAPTDISVAMSRALREDAESRNVTLVEQDDPSATYRVKGYLSAIGDASGASLVYVFDVLDTNGRRLHRISGQEHGNPASTDPWTGIRPATATAAARRAIDALADWAGTG